MKIQTSPAKLISDNSSPTESILKDNYRLGIEALFDTKSDDVISNGTPDHAALLFELFFRKAKERVAIFCRNLAQDVFGRDFVIEAARDALVRGVRIQILVQDEQPQSQAFSALSAQFQKLAITHARSSKVREIGSNFAVMDSVALRFEPKRDQCVASACMYAPVRAVELLTSFNQLRMMDSNSVATG